MGFALSTRWMGRRPFGARELLEALRQLGTRDCALAEDTNWPKAAELAAILKPAGSKIVALRVRFSADDAAQGRTPSLLASADESVAAAIGRARQAAAFGREAGARLIVLDLGEMEIDRARERAGEMRAAYLAHGVDDDLRKQAAALDRDRDRARDRHLERASRALFRLARLEPEMRIAVLTPDSPSGFPDRRALEPLLDELKSVGIAYWHDAGRAHLLERMLGWPHHALAGERAASIVGVSLHDVAGAEMHRPPGSGEIDFAALAEVLPKAAARVLEIDGRHPAEQVRMAMSLLESVGI